MGNGNQKENLYDAVDADDCEQARAILTASPAIINEPVSDDNPITPLGRAAWRGNVEMVYTLLEFKADVNVVGPGPQGVSPLQWAAQRGKDETVDFLVQKGAKIDYVSKEKLNALDYAILYGSYNTAWKLINLGLEPKGFEFYKAMSDEKHILYYDYEKMIEHLNKKTPLEETPPFNIPPPEPGFKDPVIDPRESWAEFGKRILNFEEPPLVERADLPPELRPENRFFGKLRSLVNGQSPYPEEGQEGQEGQERAERPAAPERPIERDIVEEKKKKAEESVVLTSEEAGKDDEDEASASERFDHVVDMPGARPTENTSERKGSEDTGVNYSTDKLIAQNLELQPVKVAANSKAKNNEQSD